MRYLLYFILGGALVSAIAYLGGIGRPLVASFLATAPVLTLLGFILLYVEGGLGATERYAVGLLIFLPGWLAYVCFIWLTASRLGFWPSLAVGVSLFYAINYLTVWLAGIGWR